VYDIHQKLSHVVLGIKFGRDAWQGSCHPCCFEGSCGFSTEQTNSYLCFFLLYSQNCL